MAQFLLKLLLPKTHTYEKGLRTSEIISSSAPYSIDSKHFYCSKYMQITFKEELQKKLSLGIVHIFKEKKIDFLLNHVEIHVIYVKKFLTKIDVSKLVPVSLDLSHLSQEYFYVYLPSNIHVS